MLKKSILLLVFFVIAGFACAEKKENKKLDGENAQMVSSVQSGVATAISEAMANATSPRRGMPAERAIITDTYNYTGTYYNCYGSFTYDDVSTYPMNFDWTFTWKGYAFTGGSLDSGTCKIKANMPSEYNFTEDYTGDFDITYNGAKHSFSWDFKYVLTEHSIKMEGTVTLDGDTYDYDYSASY